MYENMFYVLGVSLSLSTWLRAPSELDAKTTSAIGELTFSYSAAQRLQLHTPQPHLALALWRIEGFDCDTVF
jgi:hypothetical protein